MALEFPSYPSHAMIARILKPSMSLVSMSSPQHRESNTVHTEVCCNFFVMFLVKTLYKLQGAQTSLFGSVPLLKHVFNVSVSNWLNLLHPSRIAPPMTNNEYQNSQLDQNICNREDTCAKYESLFDNTAGALRNNSLAHEMTKL
jgi:hypothetical protein